MRKKCLPFVCRFLCRLCVADVLEVEWRPPAKPAVMRKTACCRCVDFRALTVPFIMPIVVATWFVQKLGKLIKHGPMREIAG